MGTKLTIEEMLQCGSYQYKVGKKLSATLKKLEEAVSNMPNSAKASSTGIGLWDKSQATPTLAEIDLQQLETRQQSKPASKRSEPVNTQDIIDIFLSQKDDAGCSPGYLDSQRRKLKQFSRQYPKLPTSSDAIRDYLRHFKTDHVSTRQDTWKLLSRFYKFAVSRYGIPNPMLTVDKPRYRKKPGQRLSRDEAKQFLSAVHTNLEWALVTCYLGLRLRRIEAERLRLGDIKSDYIIIRGKERNEELPLLPVFREKLLALRTNQSLEDPLFSMKADTMAYHIKNIFKKAGIEGVRASPHTLRNTAGALWSTFGGDWTANRQLLRHSAQTITDHYSHSTIDELMLKDKKYNPMLNLMRELGLAPQRANVISDYQDTTGGQAKNTPLSIPS